VNYLIDTNVISEVGKGARCDANVADVADLGAHVVNPFTARA
jgi:hypothetical protein